MALQDLAKKYKDKPKRQPTLHSRDFVAHVVFNCMGEPLHGGDYGTPSVSAEVLAQYPDNVFAKLVIAYRSIKARADKISRMVQSVPLGVNLVPCTGGYKSVKDKSMEYLSPFSLVEEARGAYCIDMAGGNDIDLELSQKDKAFLDSF